MEPGVIKKLDETVVNRIAAGEIIQRPANALKELIENSLDAKSTNIQIIVKSGGLKLLQIQDNGTGIRRNNLDIVCERFTTSKLKEFEDLNSIATYGFRGEALASISHVAHLTIQTKTKDDKCASRASYEDGKLKGEIKLCAGNQGTQIIVEDLFFNVVQRRQALKGFNEEYQKVYDVVCKYAVHNSGVGFVLKKFGESNAIRTTTGSNHVDNIRIIYGNAIAKELLKIEHQDNLLKFSSKIYLTKVNFSMKKSIYLFFINHRLVDSVNLKNKIDEVYSLYLPKGTHPFVYLSLEIDSNNIDVNVHPTKHEVHFLHEDEIIEKLKCVIEKEFLGGNETRIFYTQSRLPGASDPTKIEDKDEAEESIGKSTDKIYAKDLVRTDSKEQKLDKFFANTSLGQKSQSLIVDEDDSIHNVSGSQLGFTQEFSQVLGFNKKTFKNRIETKLTSILKLRKRIENKCHNRLRTILSNFTFVGVIDRKKAAIQFETELYLCDIQIMSEELFYEILLYDFGNFNQIKLFDGDSEGFSIKELSLIYLNSEESEWTEEDGDKEELALKVQEILVSKSIIMKEYFKLNISDDGRIETLPMLLENHSPCLSFLPRYVLRLATEVNWDEEEEFFNTFSRETAYFYSKIPYSLPISEWNWTVEHSIFPAIKQYLIPPRSFAVNKCLLQIASLSKLYKVFERC